MLLCQQPSAQAQQHLQAAAMTGPEGIWLIWNPSGETQKALDNGSAGTMIERRSPSDTGLATFTKRPLHGITAPGDLKVIPAPALTGIMRLLGIKDDAELFARIVARDASLMALLSLDRHARTLLGTCYLDAASSDSGDSSYRIRVVDMAGRVLSISDTLHVSNTYVPVVTGPDSVWTEPVPNGTKIFWPVPAGEKAPFAFHVYRAPYGSDAFIPVTIFPKVTMTNLSQAGAMSFVDTTAEGMVRYAVAGVDYAGNKSKLVMSRDIVHGGRHTVPTAPLIESVSAVGDAIRLRWSIDKPIDYEGVVIERRNALDSVWIALVPAFASRKGVNEYTDINVIPSRFYQYRLRRQNQYCKSLWSHSQLAACSADVYLRSMSVMAEQSEKGMVIKWKDDSSFAGVATWRVYSAETENGPWKLISNSIDRSQCSFVIEQGTNRPGDTWWYQVRGVDHRGVETIPSEFIALRTPGLPAPSAIPVITTIRQPGMVQCSWPRPDDPMFAGTWAGSINQDGNTVDMQTSPLPDSVFSVTFPITYAATTKRVIFAFVNSNGERGPLSAPVELVEHTPAPPGPVGLSALQNEKGIVLQWAGADTVHIRAYRVWAADGEDGEFTLLAEVAAAVLPEYQDTRPSKTRRYCVSAVGRGGTESARSTAVLIR
jgi:hypothetical protein